MFPTGGDSAFVAFGASSSDEVVIGEVGQVQGIFHQEQFIEFTHQYVNPVVIISPLTRFGGDPAIARITDIQSNGFSAFVQEPTLLRQQAHSGGHIQENFSYLVIESGSWTMADGTVIETGLTEVDSKTSSANWDRIEFANNFEAPTVLSSVQTYNNSELVRLRQRNGDLSGIDLALEKEEALVNTDYAPETVGFIALDAGQDNLLGESISYVAGQTGRAVDRRWHSLDIDSHPYVFASTNSFYGVDSVGLRYQMGSVMLEEDTSKDNEINHVTEDVAYLGFSNLGTILGSLVAN